MASLEMLSMKRLSGSHQQDSHAITASPLWIKHSRMLVLPMKELKKTMTVQSSPHHEAILFPRQNSICRAILQHRKKLFLAMKQPIRVSSKIFNLLSQISSTRPIHYSVFQKQKAIKMTSTKILSEPSIRNKKVELSNLCSNSYPTKIGHLIRVSPSSIVSKNSKKYTSWQMKYSQA